MKLSEELTVDIHDRFRGELREQQLPEKILLRGNEMQKEICKRLLKEHAPYVSFGGTAPVCLMSMEEYGSSYLAFFMENKPFPKGPVLLYSIPEELLVAYAKKNSIPVVREERGDIRKMLDKIAEKQPQTYFSLMRSTSRMRKVTETLRTEQKNPLKEKNSSD